MTRTAPARTLVLFASAVALTICLAGCTDAGSGSSQSTGARPPSSSGQNPRIPDNARQIARASGTRIVHRTLRDGTIYVQDKNTGRVVYRGPVRSNDNVVVDPKANAVAVNDNQVERDPKLDAHHTYVLYFVQR
jgi:hypothetical protein